MPHSLTNTTGAAVKQPYQRVEQESLPSRPRTLAWPGRCFPRVPTSSRSRPEHDTGFDFPPPRDDQALMSQGLDPRWKSSIMSRRHRSGGLV